jgi:hypothetical protein
VRPRDRSEGSHRRGDGCLVASDGCHTSHRRFVASRVPGMIPSSPSEIEVHTQRDCEVWHLSNSALLSCSASGPPAIGSRRAGGVVVGRAENPPLRWQAGAVVRARGRVARRGVRDARQGCLALQGACGDLWRRRLAGDRVAPSRGCRGREGVKPSPTMAGRSGGAGRGRVARRGGRDARQGCLALQGACGDLWRRRLAGDVGVDWSGRLPSLPSCALEPAGRWRAAAPTTPGGDAWRSGDAILSPRSFDRPRLVGQWTERDPTGPRGRTLGIPWRCSTGAR